MRNSMVGKMVRQRSVARLGIDMSVPFVTVIVFAAILFTWWTFAIDSVNASVEPNVTKHTQAEILAKIGATGIVMVYNFVTRKIFMEKHD